MTVSFVSLGCAKNLIDSEKILGLLAEDGVRLVGPDDPADVTIVNTCGFIEEARAEALEHIQRALDAKHAGQIQKVVVAGCLAQHWGRKLTQLMPDIDAVVGLGERNRLAVIIKTLLNKKATGEAAVKVERFRGQALGDQARLRLTDACWTYLRISEGCSQGCTFCTIPSIRGPFRSKAPEAILAEAEELIADGAIELNLIGQETSGYGRDLKGYGGFARLLRDLNQLKKVRWLRVLYSHPASITDDQITAMAECDKVVPYLDLPLQHINDRILKLMHRRITRKETEDLLGRLRQNIDNLALRTTMLVGFPSETEAEFRELLDFVREFRFEALGGFAYSPEEGTRAGKMDGQISIRVKNQRLDRLMAAQQTIAFEIAESFCGRVVDCLLTRPLAPEEAADRKLAPGKRWFAARHAGQAPEIDSECYVSAPQGQKVTAGRILPVKITRRRDYDLIGTLIKKTKR